MPALAFLAQHITSLQLLGKTAPTATSSWAEEGEPPSWHMSSVGAGAAAGLGNAEVLSSPLQRQEVRHSWLVFAAQQVFSVTNGTLVTLTQENQRLCSAVTHTPLDGLKVGDLPCACFAG